MQSKLKKILYKIGLFFIILAFISPLIALIIPFFNFDKTFSSVLIGFFLIGGPELFLILGGLLAGKKVIDNIKNKVKGLFSIAFFKKPAPQWRFNLGIAMIISGMLAIWILAYLFMTETISIMPNKQLWIAASLDALTFLGIFAAGPEFWNKLRKLFIWAGSIE